MNHLFLRNIPIIGRSLGEKLGKFKLCFVGCGLGGNIAVLAARTGFRHFVLVDGDMVEKSNLNRQEFDHRDLGKPKVSSLKRRIKAINPQAQVKVFRRYVSMKSEILRVAGAANVIINTADFSRGFFEVLEIVSERKKIAVVPLNVGFGSVVTVFDENNVRMFRKEHESPDEIHGFRLLLSKTRGRYKLPKYFAKIFKQMGTSKLIHTPQVGIAAELTAALAVFVLLRAVSGNRLPMFPRNLAVDLEAVWSS